MHIRPCGMAMPVLLERVSSKRNHQVAPLQYTLPNITNTPGTYPQSERSTGHSFLFVVVNILDEFRCKNSVSTNPKIEINIVVKLSKGYFLLVCFYILFVHCSMTTSFKLHGLIAFEF